MDYKEDLDIVIESHDVGSDGFTCNKSYVYLNGERLDSDNEHIRAILEYLGYNVTVEYL